MIIPPPDIRVIVDKTAQFVGKNGPEFEQRILTSEKNNVKFNFLTPGDPYHAYYREKVDEAKAQASGGTTAATPQATTTATQVLTKASTGTAKPVVLEAPKKDEFTIPIPAGISAVDLDVIKVTAQFAARNGKKFVTTLASKEQTNPQFNFLKPHHSMFTFFTALADAYEKIVTPDSTLLEAVEQGCDKSVVLERVMKRLDWELAQDKAKKDKEDAEEEERIQMALIDWNSFVVVETLDFEDAEDDALPPPMKLNEIIEFMRKQELEAPSTSAITSEISPVTAMATMDAEEREMVLQAVDPHSNPEPPLVVAKTTTEGAMKIVRNYKKPEERKAAAADTSKFVVSPITGEMVALDQMAEHMRISLIDPKWKQQREAMLAKLRGSTQASHEDVAANVLNLAKNRPDIFGSTDAEVSKAVAAELSQRRPPQVTAPPPPPVTTTVPMTALPPALSRALPPKAMSPAIPLPSQQTLKAVPPPPPAPRMAEDKRPGSPVQEETEPEPKKLKVGSIELDDEIEFLEAHPGSAVIKILCPKVEGNEDLTGQTLQINVDSLKDNILDLKRAITPLVGELAQNKQKLSTPGLGFLKDTATLAYYNLKDGSTIMLTLKERGGGKR